MLHWLRKRLGVLGCMHRLDECDTRLSRIEKYLAPGLHERDGDTSQRYDEIERARSRRKKDHSLHGGYVPHG